MDNAKVTEAQTRLAAAGRAYDAIHPTAQTAPTPAVLRAFDEARAELDSARRAYRDAIAEASK